MQQLVPAGLVLGLIIGLLAGLILGLVLGLSLHRLRRAFFSKEDHGVIEPAVNDDDDDAFTGHRAPRKRAVPQLDLSAVEPPCSVTAL